MGDFFVVVCFCICNHSTVGWVQFHAKLRVGDMIITVNIEMQPKRCSFSLIYFQVYC